MTASSFYPSKDRRAYLGTLRKTVGAKGRAEAVLAPSEVEDLDRAGLKVTTTGFTQHQNGRRECVVTK